MMKYLSATVVFLTALLFVGSTFRATTYEAGLICACTASILFALAIVLGEMAATRP